MGNPKIDLQKELIDNILDIAGWISVALLFGVAFYYYGELPEKIPTHFNFKGEPDAWGDRSSIWTMPLLGIILFLFLFFINKFPHQFNFPMKITKENAQKEYRKVTRTMRFVNLGMVLMFLFITWKSIQTALGNTEGLGNGLLIVLGFSVAGLVGYLSSKR